MAENSKLEGDGELTAYSFPNLPSKYVPFIASESGTMPVVYTSEVRIVPRVTRDRNR